ncbi:SAF domain-containing protein [Teratosphaeria destructans]|uniref:SAF domain-containing protein n=1 Tax=Teratosphaeria destructans TaxID=418781 RepID=A0A9W7SU51_9PEZI|nr:SAF domain-containing protein [Teratosphaeria destructans]
MVYGVLVPAERSLEMGALPVGLAHGLVLRSGVRKGEGVRWGDVEVGEGQGESLAVRVRREMEEVFRKEFAAEAAAAAEASEGANGV